MIPLIKTNLPESNVLIPELEKVLYSGYISQGKVVDDFEERFGSYLGNRFCVSVNSGTAALHIALILADVKPGDEVISTALTAEPTNTVIAQTGAKIIWADIDPNTGTLCPEDVESKITNKTKAIMLVHYAGIVGDIESFLRIEEKYSIPVIEDSAHALGAEYKGKKIGNHFKFSAFSFQAIKHMTTIDGGMLCLKRIEDYERAKLIRWFGIDKKKTRKENDIYIQGYKYHMNNVNAQIGIIQLERIEKIIDSYRNNGLFFDNNLKGIENIGLLKYPKDSKPSYWLYTIKTNRKEDIILHLSEHGIAASDLHKRNDKHSIFRASNIELPNVDAYYENLVHIPCGWWLSTKDKIKIVDAIKNFE